MYTRILLNLTLASITFVIGACDQRTDRDSTVRNTTPTKAPVAGTDAENTARNKVDRDTTTKTPMDQSNSSADIKITAEIRRAIMEDKSMSMNAQNCKVITDKTGVVTLRGPVDSQAEKDAIASKAKAIAGVSSVVNELEVKQN